MLFQENSSRGEVHSRSPGEFGRTALEAAKVRREDHRNERKMKQALNNNNNNNNKNMKA
jgi:hypothetical protein